MTCFLSDLDNIFTDESIASNGTFAVLPNIDSTKCIKGSSLNETLDNENTEICRLAENVKEEPFDTCDLKNNFPESKNQNLNNFI